MCSAAVSRSDVLVAARALAQLDERRHLLAPALVRRADHHRVVHVGVMLERVLDLLGEDLLAAGVDRDRVAAEQLAACRRRRQRARSPGTE